MSEIREGAPEGATHCNTTTGLYYKVVGNMVDVWVKRRWTVGILREAKYMNDFYVDVVRIKTLEEVMDEYLGD